VERLILWLSIHETSLAQEMLIFEPVNGTVLHGMRMISSGQILTPMVTPRTIVTRLSSIGLLMTGLRFS
jgi:hypothetical protein